MGNRFVIMRCDKDTAIRSNAATCFSFATIIVVKLRKSTPQCLTVSVTTLDMQHYHSA